MTESGPSATLVVLGASFAGLELVHQLRKRGFWCLYPHANVLVIDQRRASPYIPLIHEALLDPTHCAPKVAFSDHLERLPGVEFRCARVVQVDFVGRQVQLADGTRIRGAQLVAAMGSRLAAPESIDPQGLCVSLKFSEDLERQKRRIADLEPGARIVVVGGGLSAVELAGELAAGSIAYKVALVSGQGELLSGLPPRAQRLARSKLQRAGVELYAKCRVEEVFAKEVLIKDAQGCSKRLSADLVFWAGGVSGPKNVEWIGARASGPGWLTVDTALRVLGEEGQVRPGAYVIGDLASIIQEDLSKPVATMRRAIEAIWQAQTLARNLCLSSSAMEPASHPLRTQWPYGVSIGAASLICAGSVAVDLGFVGRWFRRWLEKMYLRRYNILPPR